MFFLKFNQNTPVDVEFLPGDRTNTHCVYKQGPTHVPFGLASSEEMCIHYISYWPKVSGNRCSFGYSVPNQRNGTMCGTSPLIVNGIVPVRNLHFRIKLIFILPLYSLIPPKRIHLGEMLSTLASQMMPLTSAQVQPQVNK